MKFLPAFMVLATAPVPGMTSPLSQVLAEARDTRLKILIGRQRRRMIEESDHSDQLLLTVEESTPTTSPGPTLSPSMSPEPSGSFLPTVSELPSDEPSNAPTGCGKAGKASGSRDSCGKGKGGKSPAPSQSSSPSSSMFPSWAPSVSSSPSVSAYPSSVPSISNAPSVSSMPSCGKGGKAGKGSKKSGKAKGESSECSGKGSKRGKGKSKSKKGEKNDLELDLSRTDHITNFDAGLATSSTTPRYMLTSVLTWQSVAFVALAMQTFFV